MDIQKNKKYILRFDINGKFLSYHCEVTEIDDKFVSFIDRLGDKYTYKLDYIVGYQEMENEQD